jgi:hypothetical protein
MRSGAHAERRLDQSQFNAIGLRSDRGGRSQKSPYGWSDPQVNAEGPGGHHRGAGATDVD